MQKTKSTDINILEIIFFGEAMTIHYMQHANLKELLVETFWIMIMYMGFPILSIFEWLHWEIYGKGPRKGS
jgi:hypothetical protein